MDTVDALLITFVVLLLSTVFLAALARREHHRAELAQKEITRLVAQSRPRSPLFAAGYDTGLVERPIVQVPPLVSHESANL